MGSRGGSKLYLLPLGVAIIFPLTFIITFSVAISKNHVNFFFSYISDTGAIPQESLIFAQLLNIAGVLIGLSAYVRFKQVETFIKTEGKNSSKSSPNLGKFNKIGIIFGMICALGSSVVGIFNEKDQIFIHVVGAWMAFGGGSVYFIFQALISFQMVPLFGTKALAGFRMVLGCVCLSLFLISFMTGVMATNNWVETGNNKIMLKWLPENGGWAYRVTSVTTEWIMAALLDIYFITLIDDFRKIRYETPKVGNI
ncbi:DNA damage-regulated autophagy modulator protein 2 [Folsomia candida]|uniref:DNA damage-regulated autophagy modulator protein 2 n=1 Tax=Folsomia candida TaxID=158441 RepID=A0A226DI32_FOLCA|nr:DNA damage-regulated autophagy modulator protein 2 [Folsomia candida]